MAEAAGEAGAGETGAADGIDGNTDGSTREQWTPIRREALLAPVDDPSYGGAVPPELPSGAVPGPGPAGADIKAGNRSFDGGRPNGSGAREVMVPGDDVSLDLLERARSMLDDGTGHLVVVPGPDGHTDQEGDVAGDADGRGERPVLPRRVPGAALDAEFAAAMAGEAVTGDGHATDPDRGGDPDREPDRDGELVFVGGPGAAGGHEHQEHHGGPLQHVDATPPQGHDPVGPGLIQTETERKDGDGG